VRKEKLMKRVVVYQLKNGKKEVFDIGLNPETEQHERATAEREVHDPKSLCIGYLFEWRSNDAGNGQHCWEE
jgi:hypothetical protein